MLWIFKSILVLVMRRQTKGFCLVTSCHETRGTITRERSLSFRRQFLHESFSIAWFTLFGNLLCWHYTNNQKKLSTTEARQNTCHWFFPVCNNGTHLPHSIRSFLGEANWPVSPFKKCRLQMQVCSDTSLSFNPTAFNPLLSLHRISWKSVYWYTFSPCLCTTTYNICVKHFQYLVRLRPWMANPCDLL